VLARPRSSPADATIKQGAIFLGRNSHKMSFGKAHRLWRQAKLQVKEIEYTDFPLDEIKLYFTDNTILLPGEGDSGLPLPLPSPPGG